MGQRLGQHFLKNEGIAKRIAFALNPAESRTSLALNPANRVGPKSFETILEIGAGEGMLTRYLLEQGRKVVAIEKDGALVEKLQDKFRLNIENRTLDIISGDVRDFDPKKFFGKKKYVLIANIPYYITGLIVRKFLETERPPEALALLIQKEVAKRIIARDGRESLLSISVKVYGTPKIAFEVKRGSFTPPPKVDSAVLIIENISKKNFQKISEEKFFGVLRVGFAHPRKRLMKNLEGIVSKETIKKAFIKLSLSENARAENMILENWLSLANKFILR